MVCPAYSSDGINNVTKSLVNDWRQPREPEPIVRRGLVATGGIYCLDERWVDVLFNSALAGKSFQIEVRIAKFFDDEKIRGSGRSKKPNICRETIEAVPAMMVTNFCRVVFMRLSPSFHKGLFTKGCDAPTPAVEKFCLKTFGLNSAIG